MHESKEIAERERRERERVYDALGITLDVIAEAHNAGSSSFASPSFPSGTPTLNASPRYSLRWYRTNVGPLSKSDPKSKSRHMPSLAL